MDLPIHNFYMIDAYQYKFAFFVKDIWLLLERAFMFRFYLMLSFLARSWE